MSLLQVFKLLSTCESSTAAISTALNTGVCFLRGSYSRKTFNQWCTISRCLIPQETTYCTVTPNICTSSPRTFITIIIIIIINIKEWTLWSVPSPQLQLLAPTLLRSSNCSPSLRSVAVWFQRDSVLWLSLQVWKPVPSVSICLVQYACNPQFAACVVICFVVIKGVACQRSQ